jgi:hypothetical protein
MPSCHVSVSIDFTIQFIPTGHNYAPLPPPAPPPVPAPAGRAIELPTPQFWPTGFGTHKQTTTIKHKGMAICLDGHDLGRFIVHVQIAPAPNNALLPLIMFKSSRKNNFKAATVKMDKTPTGTFILLNAPPMPMTSCCEPIAFPMACSTMSWLNSVDVGMSWASYLISALTLAANLLIERFLYKRDQALAADGILDEMKAIRKVPFLGGLMSIDDMQAFGLKSAVAAASSIARLAFTNEDGSFPLIAGAPFGLEITRGEDGKLGVKASATLTKGNNSLKASASVDEDGATEGSLTATHKSKGDDKDAFGQNQSSETSAGVSAKRDKDGNTEESASVSRKTSEGQSQSGKVTAKQNPDSGKSSVTAEASASDAQGNTGKGSIEHSTDDKAGTTTDKVGVSGNSAAGQADASTSGTTDKTGTTTSKETASATPVGGDRHTANSSSVYPASPRPAATSPGLNQGGHI